MTISIYTCNPHELHMSERVEIVYIENEKFYYLSPVSEKYKEFPYTVQKCQGMLIPVGNVSNISFYSDENLEELKEAITPQKVDLKRIKETSAVG